MDDYINGYLDRCIDVICARHGIDKLNLLGICQGGTFSLCYASMHPDKVRNLVTMVTRSISRPRTTCSATGCRTWTSTCWSTPGQHPGEMLNWTFLNLKPYQLMGQKYLGLLDDPGRSRPEELHAHGKWIFDSPDQAGETFRQFIKDFFQQNKLLKGGLEIGEPVDPAQHHHAGAQRVRRAGPPGAAGRLQALKKVVGTKRTIPSCRSRRPHRHLRQRQGAKTIPPAIGDWLNKR